MEDNPLLDTAPCGFISFSDAGKILNVNATLLAWLGHASVSEVIGRSIETLLPIASRIFYQTHFLPTLKIAGEISEAYLTLKTADAKGGAGGGENFLFWPTLQGGSAAERRSMTASSCRCASAIVTKTKSSKPGAGPRHRRCCSPPCCKASATES